MEYRRVVDGDYAQIVDLQLRNLNTNPDATQRSAGFLSGSFDEPQLRQMNDDICVLVSAEDTTVTGFICLSGIEFNRPLGMPGALIAKLPDYNFDGKPAGEWDHCLCGPVCIEDAYRGRGIFYELYARIPEFAPQCNLVITAVSTQNPRSLRAHEKVGLLPMFEFDWNGNTFVCLARKMNELSRV